NSDKPTLRDILRLLRPTPTSPAQSELFRYIVKGELGDDPSLNPKLHTYEQLKKSTNEQEIIELIRKGRLPFEVVIPAVKEMTPAIWTELLYQAPYQNLLRNLATFTRHGVFADEKNVSYAVERLTNPEAIEHAKILPFRFFNAWKKYTESEQADSRIADALREALERSFVNMPELGSGTIALGIDVSGSMKQPIAGQKGSMVYCDIAGIFTGALLKRIKDRAITLPFEGKVVSADGISGRDDIMVTAEKVTEMSNGGSTAVGAPIEHLLKNKIVVDTFIGITDDQDWAHGQGYECSGSFINLWREYKKNVNPNAKAFLVTIAPYRDTSVPKGEKDVYFIYGWNANALKFIASTLNGGNNQVEAIKTMSLEKITNTSASPEDADEEE
ncbi:MAG: TROVE domain-containing protein, partial [Patescibacteria group bacterium]